MPFDSYKLDLNTKLEVLRGIKDAGGFFRLRVEETDNHRLYWEWKDNPGRWEYFVDYYGVPIQTYPAPINEQAVQVLEQRVNKTSLEDMYRLNENSEILHPDFSIEIARIGAEELGRFLKRHPEGLYSIEPREFEELIALLSRMGYEANLTQQSRDGGRDIIAFSKNELGSTDKYLVECKRYARERKLGIEIVRSMLGILEMEEVKATRGIIVTTSYFSRNAIEVVNRTYLHKLDLKDYDDITTWLKTLAHVQN